MGQEQYLGFWGPYCLGKVCFLRITSTPPVKGAGKMCASDGGQHDGDTCDLSEPSWGRVRACTLHTAHNLLRELRAKTGNRRHRRHRSSVGRYLFSVSYSLQTAVPVGPDYHPPSRSRQVAPGIVARPLPNLQMQMAFSACCHGATSDLHATMCRYISLFGAWISG